MWLFFFDVCFFLLFASHRSGNFVDIPIKTVIWAFLYLRNRVFVKVLLKKKKKKRRRVCVEVLSSLSCMGCVIDCNNWKTLLLFSWFYISLIYLLIYYFPQMCLMFLVVQFVFINFGAWLLFKAFVAVNLAYRSSSVLLHRRINM